MADVKLLIPTSDSGNLKKDFDELRTRFTMVLKELEYLLCNLDEENVTRAASVYAENIDTTHAKIADAQIESMTADKLTAGTINADEVAIKNLSANSIVSGTIDADKIKVINLSADLIETGTLNTESVMIASGDGKLAIYDTVIAMFDSGGNMRFFAGLDTRKTVNGEVNKNYNKFRFDIMDENGASCIHFNNDGDAVFSGVIDTASDINVGNQLCLNNAYEEGGIYYCNKNGSSMASVMCDRFDDSPGILVTAESGLYINGEKAATENYVAKVIQALLSGGITE